VDYVPGGGVVELLVLGDRSRSSSSSWKSSAAIALGSNPGGLSLSAGPAGELGLDLVDRLRAEVADVEQVGLAAGDELAHGVDALALEAVVGPDGQVQVLDRQG
jgi:hypothetical protein